MCNTSYTRLYEDFETLWELRGLVENVRAFAAYKLHKPLERIKGHTMVTMHREDSNHSIALPTLPMHFFGIKCPYDQKEVHRNCR